MEEVWVVYPDSTMGTVAHTELQRLIETDKIVKFHRSEGWVYPDIDPIRRKESSGYHGPERREINNSNQSPGQIGKGF